MLVDSILHPHNVGVRRTKRTVADASSVLASTTSKSHTLHRHDILPTALYYNSCCIYPVSEHVDYMLDTHVFMRRGSGVQDDLHRNIPVSNSHLNYLSLNPVPKYWRKRCHLAIEHTMKHDTNDCRLTSISNENQPVQKVAQAMTEPSLHRLV